MKPETISVPDSECVGMVKNGLFDSIPELAHLRKYFRPTPGCSDCVRRRMTGMAPIIASTFKMAARGDAARRMHSILRNRYSKDENVVFELSAPSGTYKLTHNGAA